MIQALAIAALLLAQQPGFSQPSEKPCLSGGEAKDLALFFLPALVEGVTRKCQTALPAAAYLRTQGQALANRLRAEGGNRWPAARGAMEKISGQRLSTFLGERMTMRMAEATVVNALTEEVEPESCGKIDEVAGALSPLPADNLARVIVVLMSEGGDDDDRRPFRICEANR